MNADIRIGISGWAYAPWRGVFYPAGLARRAELAHASAIFRSIEINATFYGMQTPDRFARWAEATPEDFVFAVKAPRYITHIRRLGDPAAPLANFLASGLLRLGAKLGPVLWQLPPSFRFDLAVLKAFFAMLPHDTETAAHIARRHDDHLKTHVWPKTDTPRILRHAVEIRHQSFCDPAFIDLLRAHGVALVCADSTAWPRLMDVTGDFVYCRLHGSQALYRSGYDDAAIARWAARARAWATGEPMRDGDFAGAAEAGAMPRDVFVYFDNTEKLRAPQDARAMMRRLAQSP